MKCIAALATIVVLTACGVDGEPVQPAGGVTVTLGSGGTSLGGSVGVRKGPVTLGLGF